MHFSYLNNERYPCLVSSKSSPATLGCHYRPAHHTRQSQLREQLNKEFLPQWEESVTIDNVRVHNCSGSGIPKYGVFAWLGAPAGPVGAIGDLLGSGPVRMVRPVFL